MREALGLLGALPRNVLQQYPSGRWGFVGTVDADLAYTEPDGSPLSPKRAADVRSFGPGLLGVKSVTFATREEAEAAKARVERRSNPSLLMLGNPGGYRFTTDEAEPGESWTLKEMLEANEEDEELCEALLSMKPGDVHRGGGGAWAQYEIRCLPAKNPPEESLLLDEGPGGVATAGRKVPIVSVELFRAEGSLDDPIFPADMRKTVPTMAQAEALLYAASESAPKDGTYDKFDFTIRYADGEKYEGRYDLKHWSVEPPDLSKHVRDFIGWYADEKYLEPRSDLGTGPALDDPQHRATRDEFRAFREKYELPGAERFGNPSECGKTWGAGPSGFRCTRPVGHRGKCHDHGAGPGPDQVFFERLWHRLPPGRNIVIHEGPNGEARLWAARTGAGGLLLVDVMEGGESTTAGDMDVAIARWEERHRIPDAQRWEYRRARQANPRADAWINDEFHCGKCGTIIGKNLRGDVPHGLAAEHQRTCTGKVDPFNPYMAAGYQRLSDWAERQVLPGPRQEVIQLITRYVLDHPGVLDRERRDWDGILTLAEEAYEGRAGNPRTTASAYLEEVINYGGIPTRRGDAIQDMKDNGVSQIGIDRWLQGYEASQRRRPNPFRFDEKGRVVLTRDEEKKTHSDFIQRREKRVMFYHPTQGTTLGPYVVDDVFARAFDEGFADGRREKFRTRFGPKGVGTYQSRYEAGTPGDRAWTTGFHRGIEDPWIPGEEDAMILRSVPRAPGRAGNPGPFYVLPWREDGRYAVAQAVATYQREKAAEDFARKKTAETDPDGHRGYVVRTYPYVHDAPRPNPASFSRAAIDAAFALREFGGDAAAAIQYLTKHRAGLEPEVRVDDVIREIRTARVDNPQDFTRYRVFRLDGDVADGAEGYITTDQPAVAGMVRIVAKKSPDRRAYYFTVPRSSLVPAERTPNPAASTKRAFERFHGQPARDAETFRVPSIPGVPEELLVLGELVEIEVEGGTYTPDSPAFAAYSPKTETLYAIPESGALDSIRDLDGMRAVSVTYRPHRESGKERADYQHDFEKPRPTLRSTGGKALRFAGGGYSVSDWIHD